MNQPEDPGLLPLGETAGELERRVESKLDNFEHGFHVRHPVLHWVTLITPPALLAAALIALLILKGVLFTSKMVGAATATFFVLGRFVILFGQQGELSGDWDFLSPFQLFLMVSYMDFASALLVAFHIGALFHLPWIGKRAESMIVDARFILDRMPWMRNAAFTGLAMFVAFPLAATGAVGGSILGTLLGLNRIRVFIATIVGCLLGNGLLYLLADTIGRYIDTDNPVVKYGGLVVILFVIVAMEYRYRRSKMRYEKSRQANQA